MTQTTTTSPVRPTHESAATGDVRQSPAARVQDSATRAATQVAGVHALGSPGGRALVRALGRVPGGRPFYSPGVSVEVGPQAVALDVSLVLEYGAKAVDVANQVREAVDASVAQETGLDVVEVNVTVADVHHPSDDVEPEPVATDAADADPLDALPVDLDRAEPASWSDDQEATAAQAGDEQSDDAKSDDAKSDDEQDAPDSEHTVVVLESGGTKDSDGPKVVTADEVVIADRVVVVGEDETKRGS